MRLALSEWVLSAFTVLLAWTTNVVGPQGSVNRPSLSEAFAKYPYTCVDCQNIRKELKPGERPQVRKKKLTPEKMQHIKEAMYNYLSPWVTVSPRSEKSLLVRTHRFCT